MDWLRQTWSRIRALFERGKLEREMAEEMRLLKAGGFNTYSTYSSVFRYPELTRRLDEVSVIETVAAGQTVYRASKSR